MVLKKIYFLKNQLKIVKSLLSEISLKDFNEFCDHHPGLLFPAFKFQIDLKRENASKIILRQ